MIGRLSEVGRCCGMEMNTVKNYSSENLKVTVPSTECDRYKTTENVEYLNYLCSMIDDAWCARGNKSSIASIQKEGSFHQESGLKFMEETLYGAGTWTLGRSEIPGTLEMCWRMMVKICWTDNASIT
jgi:hypothetical protein